MIVYKKLHDNYGYRTVRHPYTTNHNLTFNQMRQTLSQGRQIVVEVGRNAEKKFWYPKLTYSGYHYISILGIDLSNNKAYVGNSGRGQS